MEALQSMGNIAKGFRVRLDADVLQIALAPGAGVQEGGRDPVETKHTLTLRP
jgi:hypothetical protein